jgi:hypothetical protein
VKYSERREKYVDTIKVIIRVNRFQLYDKARLGDRLTVVASGSGI